MHFSFGSRSVVAVSTATLLGLAAASPAVLRQTDTISEADARFFETKVRPLLLDRCSSCHGETRQMCALRLDTREGLTRGGGRGAVVEAGEPGNSRLIQVIRYAGDLKMPPSGKMTDSEIATLSEWVRRGARWPKSPVVKETPSTPEMRPTSAQLKFWSFQPVRRPEVPEVGSGYAADASRRRSGGRSGDPTAVRRGASVRSPIDSFLLADLARKGLPPAPLADRRTLIRRATFDLTGLPPTPAEVTAFLDDTSPDAFARVVDRLLASPRYGERWGRHWLDLVRYCDSLDSRSLGAPGDIGEAWRYRDWVVDAFNRDLPYNEFIQDQIAGDLRPATKPSEFNRAGLIATTMLAIGNWGNGDADKEKIHTDIVDDQIDVISRGVMGLTVACARCHNHKFDPISQKDYYALAGIFFSTHILAKFTPKGAGEDIMRTPIASPAELEDRRKRDARIAELEQQIRAAEDARRASIAKSLRPEAERYLLAAWDYHSRPKEQDALTIAAFAQQQGLKEFAVRQWLDFTGLGGYRVMSQPVRDVLGASGIFAWKGPGDTPSATVNTTAEAKMLLTFTLPPHSVCIHPGPTTGVAVSWRSPASGALRIDGAVRDADAACGDGIAWKLQVGTAGGARPLASGSFENGGAQEFRQGQRAADLDRTTLRAGETVQLLVLPKSGHACDTTAVTLTIAEADGTRKWDLATDMQDDPLSGNPHRDRLGNAGVWSFLEMATGGPGAVQGPLAQAIDNWREVAGKPDSIPADRQAAAARVGAVFDLTDSRSPFWPSSESDLAAVPDTNTAVVGTLVAELEQLRKRKLPPLEFANSAQEGGIPDTPYAGFHDARIHIRGSYARLGDVVPRGFPAILARGDQPEIKRGSGRLELARWLASDTHPLTARVMVNRIWQHHFGAAIVRTPSNFGFLGERPTNPELLDWLASEFVRQGWSVKKMHRMLMLSEAYRRSSIASPLAMRLDPDNRLFGRQNRTRLEAEAIRDSLLAVAGTLETTMGGPAVRDFSLPRRTVYTITIRSDRAGFGPLFDAADTTAPIDRRTVSIVAPQALFMMNNPFALAQAKALAIRLMKDPVISTVEPRIRSAYELLYGRPPSRREIEIGRKLLDAGRREPAVARPDLGREGPVSTVETVALSDSRPSDLETWTAYCQVLLCSNEFMFVD